MKLASTHFYDNLPTTGNEFGRAFRDVELEKEVLKEAHRIGLGAQFGGKYLAHDIRIIRLPRHGASCPVGWAFPALPTVTSSVKSTRTVSGLKSSTAIRVN